MQIGIRNHLDAGDPESSLCSQGRNKGNRKEGGRTEVEGGAAGVVWRHGHTLYVIQIRIKIQSNTSLHRLGNGCVIRQVDRWTDGQMDKQGDSISYQLRFRITYTSVMKSIKQTFIYQESFTVGKTSFNKYSTGRFVCLEV